jgi:hypothetical protein
MSRSLKGWLSLSAQFCGLHKYAFAMLTTDGIYLLIEDSKLALTRLDPFFLSCDLLHERKKCQPNSIVKKI